LVSALSEPFESDEGGIIRVEQVKQPLEDGCQLLDQDPAQSRPKHCPLCNSLLTVNAVVGPGSLVPHPSSSRRGPVAKLGANAHGEALEPGRVPDCYLGLPLDPPGDQQAGRVLVVAPAALLHPAVPQPDGTLLHELVTGHPDRAPWELVLGPDCAGRAPWTSCLTPCLG
jgi:hypothetical protein